MREGSTSPGGSLEISIEEIAHLDFLEMLRSSITFEISLTLRMLFLCRWLYTGTISDKVAGTVEKSLELLCVADRYGILPLKHHLTPIIASSVKVGNVIWVLATADRMQAFQLRRHCLDFILIHFQEVKQATECFKAPTFLCFATLVGHTLRCIPTP